MKQFDLRKYLKHNPLLKEGVDPFATEEDYAIEYEIDDYEIGDEVMVQPTLTSDPISKQAQIGIVKNVDFEKEVVIVGFDDGEVGQYVPGAVVFPGDEVKQVGSADAFDNMFKGTTPDDINFEGKVKVSELKTRIKEIIKSKVNEDKKTVDSYIKKWNDKMKGSSRSTAKDWVEGIKGISKEDKESILKALNEIKTDEYGNHLEPQFKKGDKVTYLGNPGEITKVNKTASGTYTYSVSYDKGTGKTKASDLSNKGSELKKA